MDELIDVLDENGHHTGKSLLKSEAHKKGLFHPTVHVWCYSKSGKIVLQQRGKNKDTFPLKWDVSVAGHVGAGEKLMDAAIREAQEEIGVTIDPTNLEKIGVFKIEERHSKELFDKEFTHTFLYKINDSQPLKRQESEVDALKWMPLETFEEMVQNNDDRLVPRSGDRYQQVIAAIRLRL